MFQYVRCVLLRHCRDFRIFRGFPSSVGNAQALPDPASVQPVQVLTVPSYCEGVVFDQEGRGYISWVKPSRSFTWMAKHQVWAETVHLTVTKFCPMERISFAMPVSMRCCTCR